MFGHNSCLDALQYGKGEGDPPENSPGCLHCGDVSLGVRVHQDIFQHPDDEPDEEEAVRDDVIVVPEGEISFLDPPGVGVRLLQPPQEGGRADVSEAVGGDEDSQGSVHPVNTESRNIKIHRLRVSELYTV